MMFPSLTATLVSPDAADDASKADVRPRRNRGQLEGIVVSGGRGLNRAATMPTLLRVGQPMKGVTCNGTGHDSAYRHRVRRSTLRPSCAGGPRGDADVALRPSLFRGAQHLLPTGRRGRT